MIVCKNYGSISRHELSSCKQIITVIGNGGYYALASSTCLETAILANKLTYVIGIFSPMLIFFNICEICKIRIKHLVVAILYTVQMLLYMSVLTIGSSNLFYKTVQFHVGSYGGYLTKYCIKIGRDGIHCIFKEISIYGMQ